MIRIAIGFVLSFEIGAGCRYFDIPAASPPVIPGALIVLAMTLGYTSMDRIVSRKERVATTKRLCGGPTGLPVATTKSSPAASTIPSDVGMNIRRPLPALPILQRASGRAVRKAIEMESRSSEIYPRINSKDCWT